MTNTTSTFQILDLPDELITKIISFLQYKDFLNLTVSCKKLNDFNNDQTIRLMIASSDPFVNKFETESWKQALKRYHLATHITRHNAAITISSGKFNEFGIPLKAPDPFQVHINQFPVHPIDICFMSKTLRAPYKCGKDRKGLVRLNEDMYLCLDFKYGIVYGTSTPDMYPVKEYSMESEDDDDILEDQSDNSNESMISQEVWTDSSNTTEDEFEEPIDALGGYKYEGIYDPTQKLQLEVTSPIKSENHRWSFDTGFNICSMRSWSNILYMIVTDDIGFRLRACESNNIGYSNILWEVPLYRDFPGHVEHLLLDKQFIFILFCEYGEKLSSYHLLIISRDSGERLGNIKNLVPSSKNVKIAIASSYFFIYYDDSKIKCLPLWELFSRLKGSPYLLQSKIDPTKLSLRSFDSVEPASNPNMIKLENWYNFSDIKGYLWYMSASPCGRFLGLETNYATDVSIVDFQNQESYSLSFTDDVANSYWVMDTNKNMYLFDKQFLKKLYSKSITNRFRSGKRGYEVIPFHKKDKQISKKGITKRISQIYYG